MLHPTVYNPAFNPRPRPRTRRSLVAAVVMLALAACSNDTTAPAPAAKPTPVEMRTSLQSTDPIIFFKRPQIGFSMRNQWGTPVPGATVNITGPNGFSMTIVDGGQNDLDGMNNGGLSNTLPAAGVYKWCEVVAPTGYPLHNPSCLTFPADWNMIYIFIVTHTGYVLPPPTNPF